MAELADAADSKSAGLRPLGVRLPLPAPPAKAAPDAGSSHIDLGKTDGIQTPPEWSCDRVVTETGAIRRTGRQSGLESLDSAEGDERYGPKGHRGFAYSAFACFRIGMFP